MTATSQMLDEMSSRDLLSDRGVPFNRAETIGSVDDLPGVLERTGTPVVMKIVSQDIVHKSDIGGVITSIGSLEETREAFATLIERGSKVTDRDRIAGVSVQEMVEGVTEAFIGVHRSELFGPVLMIGLGGVLVELLQDVSMRLCPVNSDEVEDMLGELRSGALLTGYRGSPPADVPALVELAVTVSELAAEGWIEELDLNPVIVRPLQGRGAYHSRRAG